MGSIYTHLGERQPEKMFFSNHNRKESGAFCEDSSWPQLNLSGFNLGNKKIKEVAKRNSAFHSACPISIVRYRLSGMSVFWAKYLLFKNREVLVSPGLPSLFQTQKVCLVTSGLCINNDRDYLHDTCCSQLIFSWSTKGRRTSCSSER